nr:uncharacterized protein LOC113842169 isoform X2 [Anas platyrhynchos]
MKELPRSLRTTIIHQLVELLRTEASSWQTVAMVILSKLLECTELGDELDCVVSLFASYLRSPCLGMQSLVLRAILGLTERPATARQTLVLLPSITEQLQAADSDTRAVALPMLSTMLRLLEGRTLSLAALELASKLPALFGDVRLRPHGCVPGTARWGLSLPASQPWALRALGQARFAALLGARGLCPQWDPCPPLALPRTQVRCGFSLFASSSTRWALWRAAKRSCSRWHTGACSRCPSTCTTRTRAWPRPPGKPSLVSRASCAGGSWRTWPRRSELEDQRVPAGQEEQRSRGVPGPEPALPAEPAGAPAAGGCEVHWARGEAPAGSAPEQEPGHLPSPARLGKRPLRVGLIAGDSDLQAPRPRSRFSFRQLCSRLQKAWRRRRSSPAGS